MYKTNMTDFEVNLPSIQMNQHLIHLKEDDIVVALACVQELTWVESAQIEYAKYNSSTQFNGEGERKEILQKVIKWVADLQSNVFVSSSTSNIFAMLDEAASNFIWEEYERLTRVSGDEQVALFDSSMRFFRGEPAGSGPIHPMVLLIDAMDKGLCTMTMAEFNMLTNSEHERMMICYHARQQAKMKAQNVESLPNIQDNAHVPDLFPPNFFPPGVKPI